MKYNASFIRKTAKIQSIFSFLLIKSACGKLCVKVLVYIIDIIDKVWYNGSIANLIKKGKRYERKLSKL